MFRRNFHFRVSPTDHKPRDHPFSTNGNFGNFLVIIFSVYKQNKITTVSSLGFSSVSLGKQMMLNLSSSMTQVQSQDCLDLHKKSHKTFLQLRFPP